MMTLAAAVHGHAFFFLLFALVACAFALGVLFSNNIVHMAFYLVVSLGATAGLFFLAGAPLLGAMQLMIYVGGALVLLAFGVMLTAQKRFVSLATRPGDWILAAVAGSALLVLLVGVAGDVPAWRTPPARPEAIPAAAVHTTAAIGLGLAGLRLDGPAPGERARSGYLLPFIIVSVHLLVVLIGAAYMARARTPRAAGDEERSEP